MEGVRMLKRIAERPLGEGALRLLYQRKAFREETGTDEEHYPQGKPRPAAARPQARATGPRPAADLSTRRAARPPARDQAGLSALTAGYRRR